MPGGAAVLVDDQRGLQPLARIWAITASPSSVDGTRRTGCARSPAGPWPLVRRHLEDLLDVHHADGLVEVALDDGEPGVAGLHRLGHQVGDGVVGVQRLDLGARRHQLLGGPRAELQRAIHQRSR